MDVASDIDFAPTTTQQLAQNCMGPCQGLVVVRAVTGRLAGTVGTSVAHFHGATPGAVPLAVAVVALRNR